MQCCCKTNVEASKYLGVLFAFISGMGCLKYFEHEKAVGAGGLYRNDEYYPPGYKGIRLFNYIFKAAQLRSLLYSGFVVVVVCSTFPKSLEDCDISCALKYL